MTVRKKLIEVALPLEAINRASAYEKMPGIGPHPRGLHLWWARRPLAAARAVIFSEMVDDPSSLPDLFPTEKKQKKERERLFKIIEDLVQWNNTTNESVFERARAEMWQSWRRACADNADHPEATKIFNRHSLPAFYDPFAGGGALPLEAQRLGLTAYASDLNPVSVLINKAMIDIPTRFSGARPVNPRDANAKALIDRDWKGTQALAADVRYYGEWMHNEATKRIGGLYPPVDVTPSMAKDRPDLKPYVGKKLPVIAWLWARTVKSPNPAFRNVDIPLASTFLLSNKKGKEAYVDPLITGSEYQFTVKVGSPRNPERTKMGTTAGKRSAFRCLMSGVPVTYDHIREQGKTGQMGARLMAVVAEGQKERVYLEPTTYHEEVAKQAKPEWSPDLLLPDNPRDFKTPNYGLKTYGELFTARQLVALTTFSDLVGEATKRARDDATESGFPAGAELLRDGGDGADAYAEAIGVYLALAVDRCADFSNSCTRWVSGNQKVMNLFGKQAIAMTWDYPEAAVLQDTVGGLLPATRFVADCIETLPQQGVGFATQQDATTSTISSGKVVSTDPPYYDNIGYADLSDFFYVWLRRSLRNVFPDLFATVAVPKSEELVATPYRHGGKEQAESFFLDGMTRAMKQLAAGAHPAFPITIYYAFKQSETETDAGVASTGWETFLGAVISAGFCISGTWPTRSEQEYRMIGMGANALASSIVLVCRKRSINASAASRREFLAALKNELPVALRRLQEGNIAPVDLAQAAIGPGMAVFTRYSSVLDTEGKSLSIREALAIINAVLDETLAEQEGDFDADSRFAIAWFDQNGFAEGEFGEADVLARAKVTSVDGLRQAGILESKRGKVRLLRPSELPSDWDPRFDRRLTNWETVHHLIRTLESGGESAAAEIVTKLGTQAEVARELAYRLYTLSERKKRASEALSYNGLVQSFPEITRLAREGVRPTETQAGLFDRSEEQ